MISRPFPLSTQQVNCLVLTTLLHNDPLIFSLSVKRHLYIISKLLLHVGKMLLGCYEFLLNSRQFLFLLLKALEKVACFFASNSLTALLICPCTVRQSSIQLPLLWEVSLLGLRPPLHNCSPPLCGSVRQCFPLLTSKNSSSKPSKRSL